MSDYEKLKNLYLRIDDLIIKRVTGSSPEFKIWHQECIHFISGYFGDQSTQMREFYKTRFFKFSVYTSHEEEIKKCKNALYVTKGVFESYLKDMESEPLQKASALKTEKPKKVFIVHGHDTKLKLEVKSLLLEQNLTPIILHEQVNGGLTSILEKIEKYSDVGAAIILFSPDDVGRVKDNEKLTPDEFRDRARQNVVFEAGFFAGRLGKEKVILIVESGEIELPGDLEGIVYNKDYWQNKVIQELKEMDFEVDANKIRL